MSEIIKKMYASGGGTPLRVIRIKNADLPNGYLAYAQAYEDVVVIDETGTALMAEATAMALQLPAKSDNTTQTLDFQIDNVSGRALGYVKMIETGGQPIEVSLLTYAPNDFSYPAEQVLVMDGKVSSIKDKSFVLSSGFFDLLNKAFPTKRYNPKNTPGLAFST